MSLFLVGVSSEVVSLSRNVCFDVGVRVVVDGDVFGRLIGVVEWEVAGEE